MVICLLFFFQKDKPIPGAHAIERYLVEETIWRIISTHYKDRKEWYTTFYLLYGSLQPVLVWIYTDFLYDSFSFFLTNIKQYTLPNEKDGRKGSVAECILYI